MHNYLHLKKITLPLQVALRKPLHRKQPVQKRGVVKVTLSIF